MNSRHTHTDRLGLQLAARLDDAALALPHDISERLRAARTRAVAARLVTSPELRTVGSVQVQNGTAVLGFDSEGLDLWSRLASFVPLLALVVGLVFVQNFLDDSVASEIAEVDAALLTDDLPPTAYADPGFLQFLKFGDKALESAPSQAD